MGRIVGIDLGTTNTAVAVLQDGRPRVIEDDRGYKVLPSVVSARGEGRFIVGQAAHNLILTHPDKTVYATKRLIGRRFDSPEVQRARERLQYQLREGPDGGVLVKIGDEWMSPGEVAAVVLQVAKSITEKALGEPVDEAVVTVPAHFNHLQRQETMEAARMAGLRCERLLNEPTAAALAYGHRKNIERTLVVFDLGGGTFDITVLKLAGGVYEVLSTSGDTWLGGEDFDYRIVDHLADAFQARSGKDIRGDRNALQRLKDAAERAKCDLSFSDRANVVIPHIVSGQNLETVLTRSTLESLTGDLIQRCLDITRGAVADAGLPLSDIDEVLLVGGQTRMPRVREAVSGLFGREPSRAVHPEEAVAVGAAVQGASLSDPDEPRTVLLDVTPFDLGIDSSGGMFSPIIQKNARVPTSETRTFATVHDDQTSVRITVRQGESRTAAENEFLGEFVMEGLQPAPRMATKVDVAFRLDNSGILHVTATDRATGEKRAISVRNYADRAQEPRLPTAEEAAQDEAARAARGAAAAAPKAAPSAGVKKKAGFFASLFGTGSSTPAPKAAPTKAVVAPAAPVPEPAAEPNAPAIDLSAVAEVAADDDVLPLAEADAAFATAAEEDDLYGREAATLGMGGARLPAPRPEPLPAPDDHPDLEASALFAGIDEDGDDPPTDGRRRIAPPAMMEMFGGNSVDSGDSFGREAGGDLFPDPEAAAPAGTGLTFEGLLEGGDIDAELAAALAAAGGGDEADAEGLLVDDTAGGEVDVDFGTAPPASSTLPPAAAAPAPAFRFAADPTPAAQAIALGGADAFATGEGGGATALPADLFADIGDDAPGFVPAPTINPFDDTPTNAGVAPGAARHAPPAPAAPAAGPRKRPARLKLHYREQESFVVEYRDNLRKNGAFIKTEKPLAIGRECIFEIDAPGLAAPLVFDAVVTRNSDGRHGEPPGMGVEYRMDEATRATLSRLVAAR